MKFNKNRLNEIIAGIGFIVATVAYSVGSGMEYGELAGFSAASATLITGVVLETINTLSVLTIGIFLFLRLKDIMKASATGYLVSRIAEGILLSTGSFAFIFYPARALDIHMQLFNIAMLLLGLFSTYFCYRIFREKLAPRWLLIVGMVGYVALAAYALMGILTSGEIAPMWLFSPGAVFELIFPLWLIFKGFRKKDVKGYSSELSA